LLVFSGVPASEQNTYGGNSRHPASCRVRRSISAGRGKSMRPTLAEDVMHMVISAFCGNWDLIIPPTANGPTRRFGVVDERQEEGLDLPRFGGGFTAFTHTGDSSRFS